jgi:SAM-dependent methyltransferase
MSESSAAPDFGKAAADYAQHRQGFPESFFARIAALGCGLAGQRVLDIGTGTGLLARALAQRGCRVTGLDPNAALLDQARRLDAAAGVAIDYVQASAEATGLKDAAFECITAATCWHWFDRPRAAAECARLLAPGGRLLICDLDWHFTPGSIGRKTWDLVLQHTPKTGGSVGGTFRYPDWTSDLTRAGFTAWEAFAYTTTLTYTHEGWRGRVRASAGVGPVMDAETLARFDTAMEAMLVEATGGAETFPVGHKIFALVARRD